MGPRVAFTKERTTTMNWNSWADFFAMGGYGLYVWGSYAVVIACMLLEPILCQRRHQHALAGTQAFAESDA